jgi:hypothetical protein
MVICREAQRAIAELKYVFDQKPDMVPLLVETRFAALLNRRQIISAVDTFRRFEERVHKDGNERGGHRYGLARHYCRSAACAAGDKENLVKRAMQQLHKAREEKYFDARRLVQLKRELDSLHEPKDFRDFVAELEMALRESNPK